MLKLTGKTVAQLRRLFLRDAMYAKLIVVMFFVIWLFGATWTFWPGWIMLGLLIGFVLRAGTEEHFLWMKPMQKFMDKVLGEWGTKQNKRIEKWLEKTGIFSPLAKEPGPKTEDAKKVVSRSDKNKQAKK